MNQANLQRLVDLLNETQCGLIAINRYENLDGEKSKRRINIGFNWETLKSDDLATLRAGVKYIESAKYTKADWDIAVAELIESIVNPNEKRSKGQSDAYLTMTNNGAVRYNYNTQSLYIMGLELDGSKKVLEEGEKKVVKSAPKTIAKNVIKREYLKQGLIRNFIVAEIGEVKMRGEELELS
jgi:hypothetical protein